MISNAIAKVLGGAALAVLVMAGASTDPAAAAVLANGEFAGGQTGSGTVTATKTCVTGPTCFNIGATTTTVTVPTPHYFDSFQDPVPDPGGMPNNMMTVHGGSIPTPTSLSHQAFTLSGPTLPTVPYVFNVGALNSVSAVSMTMKIDTYTFLFTQETVLTKQNKNVQLLFDGNLISDSSGNLLPTPAEFLVSFQSLSTIGVIQTTYLLNASGATVPEPVPLAVLGAGLLGLGWVRRRA